MVVKPSGVKWHGSVGVTFHPRNEPKRIIDAAIQLFMALDAGDGILVEVFCGPDENGRSELFFYHINERYFHVIEIPSNTADSFLVSSFIH